MSSRQRRFRPNGAIPVSSSSKSKHKHIVSFLNAATNSPSYFAVSYSPQTTPFASLLFPSVYPVPSVGQINSMPAPRKLHKFMPPHASTIAKKYRYKPQARGGRRSQKDDDFLSPHSALKVQPARERTCMRRRESGLRLARPISGNSAERKSAAYARLETFSRLLRLIFSCFLAGQRKSHTMKYHTRTSWVFVAGST